MPQPDQFEILVLGSGKSGKLLAWHMAQSGRRTAVVERRWIGGSCPNVACLPTKNEIWSARVAHLARQGARFGVVTAQVTTDMPTVRRRKRDMVNREIDFHLQRYKATGTELIMGEGRFIALDCAPRVELDNAVYPPRRRTAATSAPISAKPNGSIAR